MSATVISLVEEQQRKQRMERLRRQVERDLTRVLLLLKESSDDVPESHARHPESA